MRARRRGCLFVGLVLLLTAGCGEIEAGPLATAAHSALATPTPVPCPTPSPAGAEPAVPAAVAAVATPEPTRPAPPRYPTRSPQAQRAVEVARAFLADHLGIGVGQGGLVYVAAAEWPDTGLGCPEPGEAVAHVPTPGYRVVLQVRERQYELHTDGSGRQVTLCRGPVPGERVPLRRTCSQEEIVALARQHLAGRLGVPIERVEVVSVEETEWEDDTLGCPRPPGNYPDRAYPGPIPGYRIILAAQGVQYEYHSGRMWLVFCGMVGD